MSGDPPRPNDRTRADYILAESELELGQIITAQRLRFAIQELRDTDLFTDCLLYTSPSPRDS